MSLINVVSLSIFLAFFVSYILKLVILYRKNGIKANVLAKGGKSKEIGRVELTVKATTFIWGAMWLVFSVAGLKAESIIGPVIKTDMYRYIGLIALAIGVSAFISAMVSLKTSWRVGIDKQTQTSLITSGVYRYSRNPAFVGFDIMFTGFVLTFPSVLTIAVAVINIVAVHRLILQEEKHLKSVFGKDYIDYMSKTPRYALIK
ncbi:isoprenylcysteine carboxyl methyltransferase (ICMT) family protein [Ruminiclostridium hungatei]|uniref:Isoprenylcysteine carboxyl methyltransferase (ICMT) family protein n=1 Tax=Ruminiclostridium hungatei TaxID=48256 RepID=A0A1V4SN00_RUMHU|nr:isoprenylcysteine carboxylmethyltransferase family protein [Ruminiclostridium hungatei]OPX44601.1 isoprenylcysteine carboxyl methyltransferase (ICMT) family protein [Ruminiclostridium hungatei]